ncbi:hypothetical protein jhhlp_007931 [Lomentospora prolificans]|uniref:Major facilitator superfamily (MFS) profile domain-containing protein n=1 Tax=Lomentospora prolificans TaxID=41688 RepID=A0A2N3N0Z8_9PEZI|nr:hypothetical protein jhhlp_007931 [Lomentospora prolificans]
MDPSTRAEKPGESPQNSLPYWSLIFDQCPITQQMRDWKYEGSGTSGDPFVIDWIENDARNPMNLPTPAKWMIVVIQSISTMAVSLVSSGYVGALGQIEDSFKVSDLMAILGVSLYVLGFALGPILWAPFSEVYGRQLVLFFTYGAMTLFNVGAIFSPNIETLLVLRFFAGTFGASPLTNTGGVIADIFPASQRGLAVNLYALAPFMGPVLGPIVGGFLSEAAGLRWVLALMALFCAICWAVCTFLVPETFAPLLLRKRADRLSQETGKSYVCHFDVSKGRPDLVDDMKVSMVRPWLLLAFEPIVLALTLYMSLLYGTLYLLFAAFPFVYQQARGWQQGFTGLAFLGVLVGLVFGVMYNVFDNMRYTRLLSKHANPPPESRLQPMMIGSIILPIGLFWFAWTNSPSVHWMASITAGAFFGFAMALIFVSGKNYLVDSYTLFSASALASTVIIRSLFGMAFPLFTPYMYRSLGLHWASSIPAFLSLLCTPFPFVFYKYGPVIRRKCKYAREAQLFLARDGGPLQSEEDERTTMPGNEEGELSRKISVEVNVERNAKKMVEV